MNLCPICANLVRDDLEICPYCGTPLFKGRSLKLSEKIPYDLKFKNIKERRKFLEKLKKVI
jgi:hypothetical protein